MKVLIFLSAIFLLAPQASFAGDVNEPYNMAYSLNLGPDATYVVSQALRIVGWQYRPILMAQLQDIQRQHAANFTTFARSQDPVGGVGLYTGHGWRNGAASVEASYDAEIIAVTKSFVRQNFTPETIPTCERYLVPKFWDNRS